MTDRKFIYDRTDTPRPPLHIVGATWSSLSADSWKALCGEAIAPESAAVRDDGPGVWPKMMGCAGCAKLAPDAYPTTARRAKSESEHDPRPGRDELLAEADEHLAAIGPNAAHQARESAARALTAIAVLLRAEFEPAVVLTDSTLPRNAYEKFLAGVVPPAPPASPIHKAQPAVGSSLCGVFYEPAGVLATDDWRIVTCAACIQHREKWIHAWRSAGRSGAVTGCGMDLRAQPLTVTADPAKLTCPDCRTGYADEVASRGFSRA